MDLFDQALAPPVQMYFTDANGSRITGSVAPGAPLTLNWKVPGAYWLSASLCYASVQGNPTGTGTWSGLVTGTTDTAGFHGSAPVTPTVKGTYTYVLTCGGTETGFVTLNAVNGIQVTTTMLPGATVSMAYSIALSASGGTTPYKWGYSGTLPAGLSLDSASSILHGTPTQFGSYQVILGVQDSSNPPLLAAASFPLTITSGLLLGGSLNNATVGSMYTRDGRVRELQVCAGLRNAA